MIPRASLFRSRAVASRSTPEVESASASPSVLPRLAAHRELLTKALAQSRAQLGDRQPGRPRAPKPRRPLTAPEAKPGSFSVRVVEVGAAHPVAKVSVELWANNKLLASERTGFDGIVVFGYAGGQSEDAGSAAEAAHELRDAEVGRAMTERTLGIEIRVVDLGGNVIASERTTFSVQRGATLLVETERPAGRDETWSRAHDGVDGLSGAVEDVLVQGLVIHIANLERMIARIDRTLARR